jgi:hypothetical protein
VIFNQMNFRWLFVLLLVASGGIVFQNCGAPDSDSGNAVGGSGGGGGGGGGSEPLGPRFRAGDELTLARMPYDLKASDLAQLAHYGAQDHFRAMLFTQDGSPVFVHMPDAANEEELITKSKQRCQLDSKRNCSLFALGNVILFNESVFRNQFQSVLQQPSGVSLSDVPGITNASAEAAGPYPNSVHNFNALALGPMGSIHRGWSPTSQDEADKLAQEYCEFLQNQPCLLYASGENLQFDINDYDWGTRRIRYAPAPLVLGNIPLVSEQRRNNVLADAVARALNGERIVIAMSRFGRIVVGEQTEAGPITKATRDRVRDQCTLGISNINDSGYQHQCFIYSELNRVVMTREDVDFYVFGIPR